MFILLTKEPSCAVWLRDRLLEARMPCGAYTSRQFDAGETDDPLAVVCDDPNTALLMIGSVRRMRVILYSTRTAVLPEITQVIPGPDGPERILEACRRLCPVDPAEVHETGHVYFDKANTPLFCGSQLYLTPREHMILRCLAMNRGRFLSASRLANYCLHVCDGSVPVHVHNINQKAILMTGHPVIRCRRFRGYLVD